ncbi:MULTISPECIES: CBS domain-containing protein [Dehalobacter]|jgi:tRNA nucleotidyltransferase (CCA-adding enzyme)|uniref:CBS domain-containing protein n=1 Tax=Dehalobacter restrictus TaxID=55583 RepID=A0A857DJU1_9FIRM|nr:MULTISPECIES: CBS domain-containing protein [Dehalobacter]MCG1026132.1 CBS domain-containing protein [Dehalobacter sp.]MDJ0305063.1 CBS domain-containing protein [Dehalobacter sp.]OCZ53465.1 tRNA nucleotidyltransferase [Dehalobacter sp. TeCB1]QHA00426.1 CBS domain-containing protein [Dehalobacter restrictus]
MDGESAMIIILSHQFLDFDALAAMAAAQKLCPEAVLVIDGKYSSYVQEFLSLAKEQLPYYRFKDIDVDKVEKIILVDTQEIERSIGNKKLMDRLRTIPIEIIDHHPVVEPDGQNQIIEMVGACTTILVEQIQQRGINLTSFDATLMALGIYDDTGSLLFANTTPRDLLAAAYLVEEGAELAVMAEYLQRPLTSEQKDLFQQLLDNGVIEKYNEMPVFISYAESREYFSGLALLAHRIGEFENAEIFFLVVKMEDRVYLVGRARGGSSLPLNEIVQAFGGGGHEKAASAVIKNGNIDSIIRLLREEIKLRAEKPTTIRDIMSYPVKTVFPDTSIEEVGKMLLKYGHTGLPVVQDEKLVGIISRRDVDKALKHGLQHAPVKGFMTRDVITVQPDLSWEEVQKLMVLHDIGRIPVVENEILTGIVSRSDVMRLIYGSVVPTLNELARDRSIARREEILRHITGLPQYIQDDLAVIREAASEMGNQVYLVGGFVRDLLMNMPNNDLDIVVEGNGIELGRILSKKLTCDKLVLHASFGTASLIFCNGTHLDIASTRREDYDFPGALPVVEESTLREDLLRRDFTINAMALCLNEDNFGDIIDYYGGFRDLQQKEIRFLHNLSFIDDPTRMLRAIKFAVRYAFKLAKVTVDAIPIALKEDVFAKISAERFTEELILIYKEAKFQRMGRELIRNGIFKAWFKADYAWNFEEAESVGEQRSLTERWLISLKNLDSNEISAVLDRLTLPKSLKRITLEYLRLKQALKLEDLSDLKNLDELLAGVPLLLFNILGSDDAYTDPLKKYRLLREGIQMKTTGKDLRQSGVREGPEIGSILKQIRLAWLEGKIRTPDEEKRYLEILLEKNDRADCIDNKPI